MIIAFIVFILAVNAALFVSAVAVAAYIASGGAAALAL
jgi:hypothetical protein